MKLRQTEFCHNCNQYVVFEFDDTTERQIIYCPHCRHEHYRELDSGTLLNIQMNPQAREVRIFKPKQHTFWKDSGDGISLEPLESEIEVRPIIGNINGQIVVKSKEGENKTKIVSERRWGRDPNQKG